MVRVCVEGVGTGGIQFVCMEVVFWYYAERWSLVTVNKVHRLYGIRTLSP